MKRLFLTSLLVCSTMSFAQPTNLILVEKNGEHEKISEAKWLEWHYDNGIMTLVYVPPNIFKDGFDEVRPTLQPQEEKK